MPRKGMRSIFYTSHSKASSPSVSRCPSPSCYTFSESMMEENIDIAESIIKKWNPDTSSSSFDQSSSLFNENRKEAKEFLKCVKDLQKSMQFFVSESYSSENLIRAQNLMQIAMKRLEKEFYQILCANRDHLDSESVSGRSSYASERSRSRSRSSVSDFEDDVGSEEDLQISSDSISEVERVSSIAMYDLKSIAECMISSGYGKECVKIYKIIRKSIIDEGLYCLGIEQLSSHQIHKMDWEVIDLKIKIWLNAVKIAIKKLFYGERILCDNVFSSSETIRESCFSEISREGAINLFNFPEIVAKDKKTPEKMFRILDLYDAISELFPEIESIFSFESTSNVRSQAMSSLLRLGDLVRVMLTDFESAIQKDLSKSAVPGGGLHPLTRYVMNYVCFLSDYSGILSDIVADWPLQTQNTLPDFYFESPSSNDSQTSAISVRLAWLILVLLCKLDGKADLYKDVSLSYLFLANNLNYVLSKVRSSNLLFLLGEDWVSKHEEKVKQYIANYEKMGWNKVLSSLPENPTVVISSETVKECFKKFNTAFETAYRTQSSWVISDAKLRDEIKVSISKKLGTAYRTFYDMYRVTLRGGKTSVSLVRFTPDDILNNLSDLFYGKGVAGTSSHSSSSKGSRSS